MMVIVIGQLQKVVWSRGGKKCGWWKKDGWWRETE